MMGLSSLSHVCTHAHAHKHMHAHIHTHTLWLEIPGPQGKEEGSPMPKEPIRLEQLIHTKEQFLANNTQGSNVVSIFGS